MQETGLIEPITNEDLPTLADINQCCISCSNCDLHGNRNQAVCGEGSTNAQIMIVGECPGEQEDKQGRPFVGPAGQLLDRLLEAIDIPREEIYMTNVVKCRPPGNRILRNTEIEACRLHLEREIALLQPKIIVCLGALAVQALIDPDVRVTKIRGQWFIGEDVKIMATFHPTAILRDPQKKRPVWEDFKKIRTEYERCIDQQLLAHANG